MVMNLLTRLFKVLEVVDVIFMSHFPIEIRGFIP